MIEFQRVIYVVIVYDGHAVELHIVFFQQFNPFHSPGEKRDRPILSTTVFIVKFLRSVNGNTHKKVVLFEEFTPFIV